MGKNWWSEPMGGCDSEGNPITVSFGSGPKEGHTLIGDGDRSGGMGVGGSLADGATHYLFLESDTTTTTDPATDPTTTAPTAVSTPAPATRPIVLDMT